MNTKTARRLTRASHLDGVVSPSTAEARARRRPTSAQKSAGARKNRKDADLTRPPIQSQDATSAKIRQEREYCRGGFVPFVGEQRCRPGTWVTK